MKLCINIFLHAPAWGQACSKRGGDVTHATDGSIPEATEGANGGPCTVDHLAQDVQCNSKPRQNNHVMCSNAQVF